MLFFHGVKNCSDEELRRTGKNLDDYLRKPLIIGQCIGRAWRIQAVRRAGSRIGAYSPAVGWEMGE
jgi:hypothetical protein